MVNNCASEESGKKVDIVEKYEVVGFAQPNSSPIEIDSKDFGAIQEAKKVLRYSFDFEACFDLLMHVYYEFEEMQLQRSLHHALYPASSYWHMYDHKQSMASRLVALLTGCKSYLEQAKKNVRRVNRALASYHESILNDAYDHNIEYRVMEQLKNYIQHWQYNFGGIRLGTHKKGEQSDISFEYSVGLFLLKHDIDRDFGFKADTLKEMEDKTDLKAYVREYVKLIQSSHHKMRKKITPDVESARSEIEAWQTKWTKKPGHHLVGLRAIKTENGVAKDAVSLSLEWDDVRVSLSEKNAITADFATFNVTGK